MKLTKSYNTVIQIYSPEYNSKVNLKGEFDCITFINYSKGREPKKIVWDCTKTIAG